MAAEATSHLLLEDGFVLLDETGAGLLLDRIELETATPLVLVSRTVVEPS